MARRRMTAAAWTPASVPPVSYHFPIELGSLRRLKARQVDPYPVMEYHMKRLFTMCAAVGASLLATSFALAVDPAFTPPNPPEPREQTTHRGPMSSYFADADQKVAAKKAEKTTTEVTPASASCACESKSCSSETPSCGNETPSCGSETPSCGSSCGCDDNWC